MTMIDIRSLELQTTRVLPAGFYNLRIANAELVANQFDGCKQINLEFRVTEPVELEGKGHYEFLKLGKTAFTTIKDEWPDDFKEYAQIDDPDFEDPRVHAKSKELKMFLEMLRCAGVTLPDQASLEDLVSLAKGKVFTAHLEVDVHKFGKREGQEKNVFAERGILPLGSESPRLNRDNPQAKSAVPKRPVASNGAVRPKPMMSTPVAAPVSFYDDEE